MSLSERDLRELAQARSLLEHPSFAARLVNVVGAPVERGMGKLPRPVAEKVQQATHAALTRALDAAVSGLDRDSSRGPANLFHRAATGIAGAAGGAMGLSALLIELPITTTLMLRSIADIGRSQGEDLDELEARLACLSVFAFGGRSESDDSAETGYFAVRAVLAQQVAEAARALAARGIAKGEAPALVRLISTIAARFGIVVSEKAAAQLVPVFGGISGAAVNMVFTEHFQRMATGHFIVRRLERVHGVDAVRAAYDDLGHDR